MYLEQDYKFHFLSFLGREGFKNSNSKKKTIRALSCFECNWNVHNWLWAGSEPWVILELFLICQDLSLMILIKIILKKKRVLLVHKPKPKSVGIKAWVSKPTLTSGWSP